MTQRGSTTAQRGGWQLSESGPAAYERYLVPRFFEPWAKRLISLVEVSEGDAVLDVACGTGVVARTAAALVGAGGAVIGVDINPAMLEFARQASRGLPIEWREGDAAQLPAADGSFDVVLCQQALQFVPDPAAVLREMQRVLAPGGRLGLAVLRSIEDNPAYAPLAETLERHADVEVGAMMRSPFPSWTSGELRGLVSGAGLHSVRVHLDIRDVRYPSPTDFLAQEIASSPLAARVGELSAEATSAMAADLERDLAGRIDDTGLVFPMETYMVTARR